MGHMGLLNYEGKRGWVAQSFALGPNRLPQMTFYILFQRKTAFGCLSQKKIMSMTKNIGNCSFPEGIRVSERSSST
jgi:hypothetical protein